MSSPCKEAKERVPRRKDHYQQKKGSSSEGRRNRNTTQGKENAPAKEKRSLSIPKGYIHLIKRRPPSKKLKGENLAGGEGRLLSGLDVVDWHKKEKEAA